MPRPKPENKQNELLFEGTVSREDLAWLLFGDPYVMYAEAAGYRDEMGLRMDRGTDQVRKLLGIYKRNGFHVIKMFMDYIARRDPHLPSELAQDKNGRKNKIISESLTVNPFMFYHDGMTFSIRPDGTVAVRGAEQPNEMHVMPDTERDQNIDTNTSRAESDLQVVSDSILMKLLVSKVIGALRFLAEDRAEKGSGRPLQGMRTLRTTRMARKSHQGMESVNKDLNQRGESADGLYRRHVIDIEADVEDVAAYRRSHKSPNS